MIFRLLFGLLISTLATNFALGINVEGLDNYSFESSKVQVYQDEAQKFDLITIDGANFSPDPKGTLSFGFFKGCLWLKFNLESDIDDDIRRILEFKNTQIDDIIVYVNEKNAWKQVDRVGDIFPYSSRKNPHRYLHLSVEPNGQYLIKIKGRGDPLALKMSLFTEKGLAERDYFRQFISGLYLSLLFFVLLVNLFIFLFFREKRNFYLLIYLVCMLFFQLALIGYGAQFIWSDSPFIQNRITLWAGVLCIILLSLFLQNFLQLSKISPRIHKILRLINIILGVNFFFIFSGNTDIIHFSHILINLSSLAVIFLLLIASVTSYRNKFNAAIYVILSKILVSISLFIFVLSNFGVLPNNLFADISLEIGISLEVIFLTLAVISSFRLFENESLEYLQEITNIQLAHNVQLSKKIEERTTELQIQKSRLEQTSTEIISSITYSKRIQSALMPNQDYFSKELEMGVIINRPKEIISGDFYWKGEIESIGSTKQKLDVIIVGDSNNFGVPGALLSILYMRILNTAVRQEEVQTSSDILHFLSSKIKTTFSQTEDRMKHNLSCSICVINREEKTIDFSGVQSSILHISKNKITEIKGDSTFINTNTNDHKSDGTVFKFQENDTLILCTDGMRKQCESAGESISVEELLMKDLPATTNDITQKIEDKLDNLLQNEDQVDDITIITINC